MSDNDKLIADLQSDNDALIKKLDQLDERILELERHNETLKNQIIEHEDTWLAICGGISKLEDLMEDDDTWENADKEDLYQFDPWHCLKQSLEFMKEQARQNELLRAVAISAKSLFNENSYLPLSEWHLKLMNATQAAIDGGALDKDGEK